MKKTIFAICFLTVSASLCFAKMLILKTEGAASHEFVVRGIAQGCKENSFIIDLKKDLSNNEKAKEQVKNIQAEMYIVLGDEAASFATENLKDKIVLYSMIPEPGKYNFNKSKSFGLDILISIDQLFSYLKSIENNIKTAGLLYGINENAIMAQYASKIASKEGITLIPRGLENEQDIKTAINELLPQVDIIIMMPSIVTTKPEVIQFVAQESLKNNIAVVGLAEIFLQYGALFTVSINPIIIGRALGESACYIAKGKDISHIKVTNPAYSIISLNLRVAELLKIKIPDKIVEKAYKTIK